MGCTPAPLCKKALADATDSFPTRDRASDGICGDEAHQNTQSDHNSGNAFDLTYDPGSGCDSHAFGEQVKAENPPWVKYIISNRRIWNPSISPDWRPYTGSNPHEHHTHFSIHSSHRDDQPVFPWTGGGIPQLPDEELDTMQLIPEYVDGAVHYFYVADEGELWHCWWPRTVPHGRHAERLSADIGDFDGQPSVTVDKADDKIHVVCDRAGANPPAHLFYTPGDPWGMD